MTEQSSRESNEHGAATTAAPTIPKEFFHQLERLYGEVLGQVDGKRAWREERAALRETIGNVAQQLSHQYNFVRPISLGGAGIVCLLENLNLSSPAFNGALPGGHYSVLKLPRPVAQRAPIINRIIYGETAKLLQLNHQNLIRIEFAGQDESGTYFYVMQHLTNPQDADDAIRENPTMANLMSILRGAFAGLSNLHENNIAHLDIKPSNIFATATHTVVGDLGFAKSVGTPGLTTNVGGTRGYQHPEYLDLIMEARQSELDEEDNNRLMSLSQVYRQQIKLSWDLFSLGMTVLILLSLLANSDPSVLATYEYRYLKLMAHRMLGEQVQYAASNVGHFKALYEDLATAPLIESSYLGIPARAFADIAYGSMKEVVDDFLKLTGESDLTRSIVELAEFQSRTIQASSLAAVPFSPRMRALIDSKEVAALADVDQLGLVKLIYPVASHSRMEHVLGTTALAARYIRALLADPLSPIFKQLVSREHVEALLIAALVHDIGHYPLAHDLEEVDPEIFHHELRTAHLLEQENSHARATIESSAWSASIASVLSILNKAKSGSRDSLQIQILQSILDGPIDADKVDYLTRDSENLRLPYGAGIDVEKLVSTLTVIVSEENTQTSARVGIQEKGRIPAESVAFARYSLFGSAYWHKTHRVLKAMLNRLAMEALFRMKEVHPETYRPAMRAELYRLLGESSDELFGLPTGLSQDKIPNSRLDAMSQLLVLWLAQKAGAGEVSLPGEVGEFRGLAVNILTRNPYKRVLVISRVRPENQDRPWLKIDALYSETTGTWEHRRRASIGLQKRVSERVKEWLAASARDDLTAGLSRSFVSRTDRGAPLLLIDSPPAGRVGARRPLEILHEPYWVADGRAELSVSSIEDSSVWSALAESYPRSLGKLRVFCAPEYVSLVAAVASRTELEQMVWDAIEKDSRRN